MTARPGIGRSGRTGVPRVTARRVRPAAVGRTVVPRVTARPGIGRSGRIAVLRGSDLPGIRPRPADPGTGAAVGRNAPSGAHPAGDRPQWQDRRPQGDRPQRGGHGTRDRGPSSGRGEAGRVAGRPSREGEERRPPLPPGPDIPEWVDPRELDQTVRVALRGLDPRNADKVAAHLVAAGALLDEDPEASLAHARAARDRASRVAAVREAVGVAAYYAGDYAEAAREIRAYRRMSGDTAYRAVLADCERAQGRPDVALRLVTEALAEGPDPEETVELRIVEAGVRLDLDEAAAAKLVLEGALGGRPDPASLEGAEPFRLRLASAYADLLELQGEQALAVEWLTAIAAADPEDLTGAVDRLGIEFTDLDDLDDSDLELDDETTGDDAASDDEVGDEDVEARAGDRRGAARGRPRPRHGASTRTSRPRSPSCSARPTRPSAGRDARDRRSADSSTDL